MIFFTYQEFLVGSWVSQQQLFHKPLVQIHHRDCQSSIHKILREQTASMNLVTENLSPTRLAIHKQIGGRIIQENEIKLAHTLEENT